MDKAEELVNRHWCYIKCDPDDDKCPNCSVLEFYRKYLEMSKKVDEYPKNEIYRCVMIGDEDP